MFHANAETAYNSPLELAREHHLPSGINYCNIDSQCLGDDKNESHQQQKLQSVIATTCSIPSNPNVSRIGRGTARPDRV